MRVMLPSAEQIFDRPHVVCWQEIEREHTRKLLRTSKDENDPATMREKVCPRCCARIPVVEVGKG
jgi:hypothetical protein